MNEITGAESPKAESFNRNELNEIESKIDKIIDRLGSEGIDMSKWDAEYADLPTDLEVLEEFHSRLSEFVSKREEALMSFWFAEGYSDREKEELKKLDREVEMAFRQPDGFLGNGATAEVYSMPRTDGICVKYIINQERYNENNHLRKEFEYLARIHDATHGQKITTPYPIFLRIHASRGHSYGMQKIDGASLSQIMEQPEKYPDLINIASVADREEIRSAMLDFLTTMHDAGLTHGDLFRRNIMLDRSGKFVVIDFGKAQHIDFPGQKEEERKLDEFTARQSIREFFDWIESLTKI